MVGDPMGRKMYSLQNKELVSNSLLRYKDRQNFYLGKMNKAPAIFIEMAVASFIWKTKVRILTTLWLFSN